ncbi:MAG: ABC transporter permease [Cellulophaga sp.]
MFRNYIKIAWRNLKRNKGYSAINIGGLALGMAVAMIISLWIYDELSFNKQFENYDRVAKVMQYQTYNGEILSSETLPLQLADELKTTYKDYFDHVALTNWGGDYLLQFGDKKITSHGNFAESGITEILNLNIIKGTRSGLEDPNALLLSKQLSYTLFGDENAVGKIVKFDDETPLTVIGVYDDLPKNSEFANLNFIGSWELYKQTLPEWLSWGNNWFRIYTEIAPNTDMTQTSSAIINAKVDNVKGREKHHKAEVFLHPMPKWYLYSQFENGVNTGGRIYYVWLFGIIGLLALLLACINFMNLMTAQSEKRAKEIGLRKTIGSFKKQLISQFLMESMLVSFFSFVLAIGLSYIFLPIFNEVAEKTLLIPIGNSMFWFIGLLLVLVTGLVAGSYPAFYLASLNPLNALRGNFKSGKSASMPRKTLVVFQYTISVVLVIATIIIYQQIDYAKERPIGYDQNSIVSFSLKEDKIDKHFDVIRQELIRSGIALEVAATDHYIGDIYNTNGGLEWRGKDPNMTDQFYTMRITTEFGNLINWNITRGRDFSKEMKTDSTGFIINEAAVKYMGFEDPIGEKIGWGGGEYHIVGVIDDMMNQSPYGGAKPAFFVQQAHRPWLINVKINPLVSASKAVEKIKEIYLTFETAVPFNYKFLDQEFAKKFAYEARIGKLVGFFALLAIFISCLGLFGLASFMAEQRTKEIGVRKVLGASLMNLWKMLSKDFILLVSISCFIAIPIAYHFMNKWLQNYEYRVEISWQIFALAIIGALAITILTVSFHAIKASLANPVKSLRTE